VEWFGVKGLANSRQGCELISSSGETCPAPGITAKIVRQARTA